LQLPGKYRGTSGPTHIESARYAPGADNFVTAGQEQGFKVLDSNGFQTVGKEGFMIQCWSPINAVIRLRNTQVSAIWTWICEEAFVKQPIGLI